MLPRGRGVAERVRPPRAALRPVADLHHPVLPRLRLRAGPRAAVQPRRRAVPAQRAARPRVRARHRSRSPTPTSPRSSRCPPSKGAYSTLYMVSARGRGAVRIAPGDARVLDRLLQPRDSTSHSAHAALTQTDGDPWQALGLLCDPAWHDQRQQDQLLRRAVSAARPPTRSPRRRYAHREARSPRRRAAVGWGGWSAAAGAVFLIVVAPVALFAGAGNPPGCSATGDGSPGGDQRRGRSGAGWALRRPAEHEPGQLVSDRRHRVRAARHRHARLRARRRRATWRSTPTASPSSPRLTTTRRTSASPRSRSPTPTRSATLPYGTNVRVRVAQAAASWCWPSATPATARARAARPAGSSTGSTSGTPSPRSSGCQRVRCRSSWRPPAAPAPRSGRHAGGDAGGRAIDRDREHSTPTRPSATSMRSSRPSGPGSRSSQTTGPYWPNHNAHDARAGGAVTEAMLLVAYLRHLRGRLDRRREDATRGDGRGRRRTRCQCHLPAGRRHGESTPSPRTPA